jgi:hypothetical protein
LHNNVAVMTFVPLLQVFSDLYPMGCLVAKKSQMGMDRPLMCSSLTLEQVSATCGLQQFSAAEENINISVYMLSVRTNNCKRI